MTRVLATARKSGLLEGAGGDVAGEAVEGLEGAVRAILDGAMALDGAEPDEPLLRNYLDDGSWFGELSGTALLAATAYRAAALAPETGAFPAARYGAWADAKRRAVAARVGPDGLLAPVVNPLDWGDRTPASESPEAQSFAVLLLAAYRDYCRAGLADASGGCEIQF